MHKGPPRPEYKSTKETFCRCQETRRKQNAPTESNMDKHTDVETPISAVAFFGCGGEFSFFLFVYFYFYSFPVVRLSLCRPIRT